MTYGTRGGWRPDGAHFWGKGLLALWLAWLGGANAWADSLEGARSPLPRATPQPRAFQSETIQPTPALEIRLPSASEEELRTFRQAQSQERAHRLGFARELPTPYRADALAGLAWTQDPDGGHRLLLAIHSPQAAALRVELDLGQIPDGVSFRYRALNGEGQPSEAFVYPTNDAARDAEGRVWSPLIFGDQIGIEVRVPKGIDPASLRLPLPRLSHLVESPLGATTPASLSDIGYASPCQVDVACRDWEPWRTVKDAVTKISFLDQGISYLCNGSLVNDREDATWTPYLLTSHHCVNSQATAATVNSFWFFARASCGGPLDDWVQLTGGAWLLANGEYSDFALLELADRAPGGSFFAGWSSDPVPLGLAVTGIHHPEGDLKKISGGQVDSNSTCREYGNCGYNDILVEWSEGHMENGSSGSGLFNAEGKLLGTLWGGNSACWNGRPSGIDLYGRFADTLPQVSRYLSESATPLPLNESAFGQLAANAWRDYQVAAAPTGGNLRVTLEVQGGEANLYARAGAKPSPAKYGCASTQAGQGTDGCTLYVPAGTPAYIGVQAPSPSSYRLRAERLPNRLKNLSARAQVLTADNILIGGFIIEGNQPKRVLVHGLGPSMAALGVNGVLADPSLTLYSGQTPIASNDDWQTDPNAQAVRDAGLAPTQPSEAALLLTLAPGPYTAQVRGQNGTTGVGQVAIYDLDDNGAARVRNLSGRAWVGQGEQVLIGGLIIPGTEPMTVVVRGLGPSMAALGVPGTLVDPELSLYSGSTRIASNNDWGEDGESAAALAGLGLAPGHPREAALRLTLAPGAYTAILRDRGGGTGVGQVAVDAP